MWDAVFFCYCLGRNKDTYFEVQVLYDKGAPGRFLRLSSPESSFSSATYLTQPKVKPGELTHLWPR